MVNRQKWVGHGQILSWRYVKMRKFCESCIVLRAKNKQQFKCENNYWGTVDQQQIIASFIDGRTKPDVGAVIFEPFEKKSIDNAGCTLKMPR
jgi:hypothetical protein